MNFSIVIPSKNPDNCRACVESILAQEPDLPLRNICVVDDGAYDGLKDGGRPDWLDDLTWIAGIEPFSFPRNVNLGLELAFNKHGVDAVILLNDDALLQTPGGFRFLASESCNRQYFGLISATTNVAGNPQQNPQGIGLREAQRVVAFVCVAIPKSTFEKIGPFDERFGGTNAEGRTIYGFDDNDYCRRVREIDLKLGVHDGCYVDHGSLCSTFRGGPRAGGDIEPARKLYIAKWGDCN